MSETIAPIEGQSGWPKLVEMANDVSRNIRTKYTSRRSQSEAQKDALSYALIQHSYNIFEPENIVRGVESASIRGIPFDERNRLITEIPLWKDAITDAMDGKWSKMKEGIEGHATNAWKSSQLDGDQDASETAGAFQKLAQSL